MVGVGILFYSFVACFYLYRPKFVEVTKLQTSYCKLSVWRVSKEMSRD